MYIKVKKHRVVTRSRSEDGHQAMALGACELLWPHILLYELGFIYKGPMMLHSDNTSAQRIATRPLPLAHKVY